MKLLKLTAKALLCLYCAALLGLSLFQRDLQYHPGAAIVAPAQAGLEAVETLKLASGDGETLVAWYAPPARGDLPLILYYHGNSGVLADRAARFRRLVASGYGLLAVSYRGYGGSTGTPTQDGILLDAEAAYNEAFWRGFAGRRLADHGRVARHGRRDDHRLAALTRRRWCSMPPIFRRWMSPATAIRFFRSGL